MCAHHQDGHTSLRLLLLLLLCSQDEVAAADNALSKLGGELLAIEKVNSWAPEGQRTAVVVKKCSKTPSKYPRTAGTPGRKPL